MPLIQYKSIAFKPESVELIALINDVLYEYESLGYQLTLRQAYYQLVARGHIPNTERSYKNIGNLINNARLAGLIDWDFITDRTRNLRSVVHWDEPSQIVTAAMKQYHLDWWEDQPDYVEVWVEKDALIDIVEKASRPLDVPYFSCRGYTSQSEMWAAAQRFIGRCTAGKLCHIVHLGDHDPSGIDMSRDIQERLRMFGVEVDVRRIALTMDQIELFNPPPNPAKLTDSRCKSYIRRFGNKSWELDALEPQVIRSLIECEVQAFVDKDVRDRTIARENAGRSLLENVCDELISREESI